MLTLPLTGHAVYWILFPLVVGSYLWLRGPNARKSDRFQWSADKMKILLTLGAPDSFGIGLRPARRATLNIATGEVYSFRDIPERVAAAAKPVVAVRGTPRQGEMPHGGYRPFDIAACRRAFPDFRYTSLADGLNRAGGGQGRA